MDRTRDPSRQKGLLDMSMAVDLERPASELPQPIELTEEFSTPDRIYRSGVRLAAFGVLVLLFLIGLFLFLRGYPAFQRAGWRFFTTSGYQTLGNHPVYGVLASLVGTIEVATVAIVVGAPVAIATALFLSEYAPVWSRRALISMVDLAAAIPSIIFGLWAVFELQPNVVGFSTWLSRHAAFIPFFQVTSPPLNSSLFIAGLVVGIMIVPIVASICREVFSLAPAGEREAALALGASRWQMIRAVVLPFGRGGMIGAVMLGLGRALEETIAVSHHPRLVVHRVGPHPPARRVDDLGADRHQLPLGREAGPPGPAAVRVRALRAHPGDQPGGVGHRQPVTQWRGGRPVTTRADQPIAPPGVLIANSSASTGSATTGPPTVRGSGSPGGATGAPLPAPAAAPPGRRLARRRPAGGRPPSRHSAWCG